MEKSYLKVDNYIKRQILNGELKSGDRIPPERELATILNVSRNSVREGLRILENMGVVCSHQGSGNYISTDFDDTIVSVMSYMYVLRDLNMDQITEFRYALEWQAINLSIQRATPQQVALLFRMQDRMECAVTEGQRVACDKEFHYILIESAGNEYMTANFKALTNIMQRYIFQMQRKVVKGMGSDADLMRAHRMIAEGIAEKNLLKGREGLDRHYCYINQYKNT